MRTMILVLAHLLTVSPCLAQTAAPVSPQHSAAVAQLPSSQQPTAAQGPAPPAAAQQSPAQQAPAQQGSPTVVHYDTGPLILVGVLLLLLGGLFYLMLLYANRMAQTGPLGTQVSDALRTVSQQQIVKALDDKWNKGEYHQERLNSAVWLSQNPPPQLPEELALDTVARTARAQMVQGGRLNFSDGSLKEVEARLPSQARAPYLQNLQSWGTSVLDQAARQRYVEERSDKLKAAGTGVKSLDYFDFGSLWGQGPEFILQFTAVVTIIFAVIALSVLQQIGKEQAGTILAAIAGYVLGQAARNPRAATATAKGDAALQGAVPIVPNAGKVPTTQ